MGPSGRTPPGQSPGPRKGLTQNPSTLRFPSLAPRYRESTAAGNDVFHKFSAFIKNPVPALDNDEEGPETRRGWGEWRPRPAPHRAPRPQPCIPASAVRSRQAGQLPARAPGARAGAGAAAARVTPPLCGRRPAHAGRLRTAAQAAHRERERRAGGARRGGADPRGDPDRAPRPQTVCAHFRQAPIPSELRSVRRYPDNALQEKEFNYTCPHSAEILAAYRPAVRPR